MVPQVLVMRCCKMDAAGWCLETLEVDGRAARFALRSRSFPSGWRHSVPAQRLH